jgi:flagellar protein FlaG
MSISNVTAKRLKAEPRWDDETAERDVIPAERRSSMEISAAERPNPLNFAALAVEVKSPELRAENHELIKAVKKLNQAESFGNDRELTFLLDRETGRPVVRIIDKRTREVIQQFPPEYVVRLADELELSR